MSEPQTAPNNEPTDIVASPSRPRLVLFSLILLGASLLLALAGAELLVRLIAPQQLIQVRPDIWQPADLVGWANRPGIRTTINTGERTVPLYTDRDGFRVGAAGRTEAATRILLIGDSFFEALQVPYEESFAGLLEQRLAARLRRPVAVHDAAVDGWDPNQYLLQTRTLMERDTFHLVVVGIYLGNDIVGTRQQRFRPKKPAERHALRFPRRLSARELVDAWLYPVNDFLEMHSHLFVLAKNRMPTLRMRLGLTAAYFPPEFRKERASSPEWDVTADICRDLAVAAASHGAAALFILIPVPSQVDEQVFRDYVRGFGIDSSAVDLEQPNRLLGAALSARGVRFFDLLSAFRTAHAEGVRLYGNVDRHLTPVGNDRLEQLVEPLAAQMLGRAAPRSSRH
ncbi:MAG: SGNH/GDSL hydrolase family protein [Gemmatimonadetes bacterium]|nr:SGNH/GDSL hydrolase family protein [Gemmatimonadota bacterium]